MNLQKASLYCIFLEDISFMIFSQSQANPSVYQFGKVSVSIFLILAIVTFMLSIYKMRIKIKGDYSKNFLLAISALTILSVCSIFHTIFNTSDVFLDKLGNRYVTLFFNPMCAPYVLAPSFILGYTLINRQYIRFSLILLLMSAISFSSFEMLGVIPLLLVYEIPKGRKTVLYIIIMIIMIESLYNALIANDVGNTSRISFVVVLIALSIILYDKLFAHSKIFLYTYFFLVLGFISISIYAGIHGQSIFEMVLDWIGVENQNVDSSDTRTFLYTELIEDLVNSNSLLFGKGAYSHYFSLYFFDLNSNDGDFYYRMGAEVYWLNLLLRCGLIYTLILISVYIKGIYNALSHGKSVFIRTIAVALIGWFLLGFISMTGGVMYTDITMYIFLGLCHSRSWLNMTDKQIRTIINIRFPKRIRFSKFNT
jgi:hypothetical protein